MTARVNKQIILANNKLTDMEKLKRIFDISKDSLKEYDSELYYAILAILDKEKKPDASGYFSTQNNDFIVDKECLECKRYLKSCNGVEDRKRETITIENSCSGFLEKE